MINVIHSLFNNVTLRKIFLKLRYPIVIALVLVLAIYIQPQWLWLGFVVSMLGEAIQLWSFASLVKNEQLTARGPYVLVRNPMYLGRYFLVLGFMLLFGNPYVIAVYTVLYYFYMVNRVKREEKRLQRLLGEPYRRYSAATNRFVPTWQRLRDSNVRFFDWQVMLRNNGHWNLVSALAIYGVILVYIVLRSHL